jgi:hypothetical protein
MNSYFKFACLFRDWWAAWPVPEGPEANQPVTGVFFSQGKHFYLDKNRQTRYLAHAQRSKGKTSWRSHSRNGEFWPAIRKNRNQLFDKCLFYETF